MFCHIQLATTENNIAQKAIIETVLQSNWTFLNIKYTTGINMINCDNLAVIRLILRYFIFQNICKGSCCIPANIKLAENIIPKGIHRTRYGLDVYAGNK